MGRNRLATVSIAYVLLVASVAGTPLAFGPGVAAAANHATPSTTYGVGQNGQCVAELTPLGNGSQTGPEYYDYRNFGSYGTLGIQETYLSQLYVYEGSDGTSLVFLHDEQGDGTGGGAVSFDFTGLPASGDWSVEDDDYDGQDDRPEDFDRDEVDWMYGYNKTDGGVYLGLGGDDWSEITIDPAFADEAWAAQEREPPWELASEGPQEWVARGRNDTTTQLNMDQSVAIVEGPCDATSTEAALSVEGNATAAAPVTLNASNPDSPTSHIRYEWDFDDDGSFTRTTENATVEHDYDGSENASTVRVTDHFGNTDTATVQLTFVNDTPPTAVADVPGTVGTGTNLSVDGSASSDEAGIESYDWTFGDGGSATGETAEHVYTEPGNYTVTLTVTDGAGTTDTDTANVTVSDATAPTANLSVPATVARNGTFQLDASGSADNGAIAEYRWDLDGNATVDVTRTTANATTDHAFATAGDHPLRVTVVDGAGNAATANATVHVLDETPPNASLSVPARAAAASNVTLNASASTDNLEIASYEWDFDGDDTVDETTNDSTVSHAYPTPGNRTVTVRVVDGDGNADTASAPISIEAADVANDSAPVANFTTTVSNPTVGQPVRFDGTGSNDSDGGIVDYRWTFDGRTVAGDTVVHAFQGAGDHDVTLTVTDDAGQVNATTRTIAVAEAEDESDSGGGGGSTGGGGGSSGGGGGASTGGGGGGGGGGGAPVAEPKADIDVTSVTANRTSAFVGQSVALNATVVNRGEAAGTERLGPALDRRPIYLREVSLGPGETTHVTLVVPLEEAGEQTITVGDVRTTVTVEEPEPATAISSVEVQDRSVGVGENTTIVATVTNMGRAPGEHTVSLNLLGEVVDRKTVTVPPGETRTVRFNRQFARSGNYTLGVGDRQATVEVRGGESDQTMTFAAADTGGPTPGLGLVVGGGLTLAIVALLISSRV